MRGSAERTPTRKPALATANPAMDEGVDNRALSFDRNPPRTMTMIGSVVKSALLVAIVLATGGYTGQLSHSESGFDWPKASPSPSECNRVPLDDRSGYVRNSSRNLHEFTLTFLPKCAWKHQKRGLPC